MFDGDQGSVKSLPCLDSAEKRFAAQVGFRVLAVGFEELRPITHHSLELLLGPLAYVDHKRRRYSAREHEMRHSMRPKSLLTGICIVLRKTRDVRRFANYLASVNVVRMRIFPVMSEDYARAVETNLARHLDARLFGQPDVTVGQFEVISQRELHLPRGGLGLASANLTRASRAHFSASHVQHADAITKRDKLQKSSAASQLDVIGVSANRKRIESHFIAHWILQREVTGRVALASSNIIRRTNHPQSHRVS